MPRKYRPEQKAHALRKRDDAGAVFRKIFGCPSLRDVLNEHAKPRLRKQGNENGDDEDIEEAVDDITEGVGDEDSIDGNGAGGGNGDHPVGRIADLIVEAGGGRVDRAGALYCLLHTPRGNSLMHRLSGRVGKRKEQKMPESLSSILKDVGVVAVAKAIADGGSTGGVTEHELSAAIEVHARKLYPNHTAASAFSKVYSAATDEGLAFRKAVQRLKGQATLVPLSVGGAAAEAVNNPADALAQIEALAAKLRAQFPQISKAAAFSKIYTDPAHAALAAAERRQNRPHA
jgi:hypothetical protein